MKHHSHPNQYGGSALGNILLIALFAYGVFVAFQYVPQFFESRALESILDSLETQHQSHPFQSAQQVEQAIKTNLHMNQMNEMFSSFSVRESGNSISIELSYQRELDLLFETRTLHIAKTVDLD